jgi:hypothetical protein
LDPQVHRNSRRLRATVIEAWDSITDIEIRDIIYIMPQHYKDVIAAHGAYIKW